MVLTVARSAVLTVALVPIAALVPTSAADRYAVADRYAEPAQIAVAVRIAGADRCVVVDRCAVVDHAAAAVRSEESRRVAPVRSVVVLNAALLVAQTAATHCGVRVVTQKDADRSVPAPIVFESVVFQPRALGCSRFLADLVRVSRLHPSKVAQHARADHQVAAQDGQLHPTAAPQPFAVHR